MKNSKLLIYSLSALIVYFIFNNAILFSGVLEKLEKYNGSYAFGYYVLIKIGGWFLLLFGSLGLLLFFYHLIKAKTISSS